MNLFQWVMLGLAAILVAPMIIEKVKGFVPSNPVPPPAPPLPPPAPEHVDTCDGLVDVVECWEHLCDCCEAQGMKDAARELKKIFPLFAIQEVEDE
tara:strand:- start:1577 stop:1864 length:288 start_codon:yes stop_codon:yes gene_type:complete